MKPTQMTDSGFFVICDGLPYCLAHKLIYYAYYCLNCQDSVLGRERFKEHNKSEFLYTKGVRLMMYMLGLISSCSSPFLQTNPKRALSPPIGVQISLNGDKNMRAVPGRPRLGSKNVCHPNLGQHQIFWQK